MSSDIGVSFVGAVYGVTGDKSNFRGIPMIKVSLFAGPCNIMGAVQYGLHPPEASVPGRTNLRRRKRSRGQSQVSGAPLVQLQGAGGGAAGADQFTLVADIHKIIIDRLGGLAEGRIAGAHDANPLQQAHGAVHLQAEISDGVGRDALERAHPAGLDVGGQLAGGLVAPGGRDFFCVQRGELALNFILKREIEGQRRIRLAVAERGLGFVRIVIAVMVEEHHLAPDLRLEFPGGGELGEEKAPRKKSAGLLAEADKGGGVHARAAAVGVGRRNSKPRLKSMQAAQPMRLYQR